MSAERDALRRRLRDARTALGTDARAAAADAVAARLAPLLERLAPRTVAGYLAVGGELSPAPALRTCRARGTVTLLPVLTGDTLAFAPFDEATVMAPNRFRIDEPDVPVSAHVAPLDVDVVLVPLVGFDDGLNRMGMGGGFYDRSFAARRERTGPPWLIGVAYDVQRVTSVLPEWWDVGLDAVVCPGRVRTGRTTRGPTLPVSSGPGRVGR